MFLIQFAFVIVSISFTLAVDFDEFSKWQDNIKDIHFQCPVEVDEKPAGSPLLEVVDCADENAVYRYDYKLAGGKKAKKGAFNGLSTVKIAKEHDNQKYNYGFRNKKCIRVQSNRMIQINGNFKDDILQGEITVKYDDNTMLRGFAKDGILIGSQRFFTLDGKFLNLTSASTNQVYWAFDKNDQSIFGCHQHRCIIQRLEGEPKSCIVVDNDLLVDCYQITEFPHLEVKGCQIQVDLDKFPTKPENKPSHTEWVTSRLKVDINSDKLNCTDSLKSWLEKVQDPNLLWYHYNHENEPFDPQNPMIEIELPWLKSRRGFEQRVIYIENLRGDVTLFKGQLINGKVHGKIDPEMVNHPAWRSRLFMGLALPNQSKSAKSGISMDVNEVSFDRFSESMIGSLKNGKLHGLVQVYGRLTMDTQGHCSSVITSKGLSYIGRFDEGRPVGPSFRYLIGGTFVYSKNGQFSGKDNVAFIYQDQELAMIGEFKNGMMVKGQESQIIDSKCDEFGMRILEFGPPTGPFYHYEEATNVTFGDQPLLRDPLDKKYVDLRDSAIFESAGEGAFAARDVKEGITYVLYGGRLLDKEQSEIANDKYIKTCKENGWYEKDNYNAERIWKYKHTLSVCDMVIDIPAPEFESTEKYQGTLGHKVNHRFDPTSIYLPIETARFGVTLAVMTTKSIKKGEEYFASYGYSMISAPKWYRELYKKFAEENPDSFDPKKLEEIELLEKAIAEGRVKMETPNFETDEKKEDSEN